MANRKLAISRGVMGESRQWGLALALPLLIGLGLAPTAFAQTAVEYGALGARQAGTAVTAGTTMAPATGQVATVVPISSARKAAAATDTGAGKGSASAGGPNCSGDMTAPSSVSVAVGKSSLLRLPEPVVKRTVGNPDVVDTRLVSPQTLYVLGIETGSTNMILQGKSGRCIVVDVQVGFDGAGLEAKVRELFPEEKGIKVSSAADSLVLTGTVSDAVQASQIVMLANAYVRTSSSGGGASAGGAAGGGAAGGGVPVVSPRVVNMLAVAAPQQVMLEVKIAEVSKTLLEKLGAQIGGTNTNGNWTYSFMSNFLFGAGGVAGAVKNAGNLVKIDGEDKDELVKILAEPTVMAISGQEGSFLAGGKIFIPVSQTNALGGAGTITLEEKEFGVGLRFTPTVLAGGRINLRVAPEVSEVNPEGIGVSLNSGLLTGTSVLPSITTRRASTTVQLFDGQTFAIGGLIKNNVKQNLKQFPFLGDVPILGALFRSNSFQNDRTELLFVVTPRLVKPLPPDYKLPTDAYTPPSRMEQIFGGKLEGQRPKSDNNSEPALQGNPVGGFEVK